MRAPALVAIAGAAALLALPPVVGVAMAAQPRRPVASQPGDPLARARDAESRWDFEGDLVVAWRDANGRHESRMPVTSHAGVVRVDGARAVLGDGGRRYLRDGSGWQLAWSGIDHTHRPALTRKYVVRRAPGGAPVAGHEAERFEIRLRSDRSVRERIALAADTGLLLRRDQVDEHGRVTRSIRFETLRVAPRTTVSTAATTPSTIARVDPVRSVERVRDPYDAPGRTGRGFVLVGAYANRGGGVQLAYTDGLQDVSIFERRGALDWDRLPAGHDTEIDGENARVYSSAGSSVVVWDADGVVYTYVGDPPWSEATGVIASFPHDRDRSTLEKLGRFVTEPFRWT